VAAWLSTAGWASAAARVIGRSWIVTPGGVLDPAEVRARACSLAGAAAGRAWTRKAPVVAKTAVKDLREWSRARQFAVPVDGPWSAPTVDVEFVWQRHELFHQAGVRLASDLHVPLVVFAPAAIVWQARQWAVDRPWGASLERRAESPALRAATIVACGTDAVAEQAARLGVDPQRVLVTPTGVDIELFARRTERDDVRARYGFGDEVVVGWCGSFRAFHAVHRLIEAAARVERVALLLVGDGPERAAAQTLAARLGVNATFTGTVLYDEMPDHLAAMDIGAVVAAPGHSFHYSPLKVAEYMAAGLPIVAPNVGGLAERLHDGGDAVLFEPGDDDALVGALRALATDPTRRAAIGAAAQASAYDWSWDVQVERVRAALASMAAVRP
jgi:glycosyltransferase involved in cell wall biosynthesis